MQITTKQLAEICGVSRGTVDRALNNRPGIHPDLRAKILETAEKLGYRPNFLAQSLVKGRTMTLGVIVFDLYNRFFAQLINSTETRAKEDGYFVYLTLTGKALDVEKSCIGHLVDRKVDGLILCSVGCGNEYTQFLKGLNIPIVTVTNKISDDLPFIGIDDYTAMKDSVSFVLNKGYQDIIYVSPSLRYREQANIYAQEQRYKGAVETLQKAGRNVSVIGDMNIEAGLENIGINRNKKTAIICSNDIYALKILNYLKGRGLRVPEDIGLMGFDNIDTLEFVSPKISTVAYPLDKMGEMAVEFLIDSLEGNDADAPGFLKHTIITGNSI